MLAKDVVNKIKFGWNLGNYLDCTDKMYVLGTSSKYSIEDIKCMWHNPMFNLKCIDTLNDIGVNCLRVPVTWCNFVKLDNNKYTIDESIFTELYTIVDYALSKDIVVIIDMHHDDQNWLSIANADTFNGVIDMYRQLWTIIATKFNKYNHNVILEGMNEVIDRSNPDKYDWVGNEDVFFERLNYLYQVFVDTVRCTGGNNKTRPLMISTYGAQVHRRAMEELKLPKDDNLVLDVHYYCSSTEEYDYTKYFDRWSEYSKNNNIPVIIGECGLKKGQGDIDTFVKLYVGNASKRNLKCVLWDNGGNRKFIERTDGGISGDAIQKCVNNCN